MVNITRLFFATLCAYLLCMVSGCVTKINLDVGEDNYRIVNNETGALQERYTPPADFSNRVIRAEEDSVAMILEQGFIADFSERFERFLASLGLTTVRGEIAIVANVFEMSDGKYMDYGDFQGKKSGRLIYYSEDVRSGGEFLNFSAIPVYGPITYGGNPLAIQLTILELDDIQNSQIKNMLSTLAGLGAKAYAPASNVLNTLDSIGSQLLSGEQDDVEMKYTFYLYPIGGSDAVNTPRLIAGDYVFIKQHSPKYLDEGFVEQGSKSEQPAWNQLCLDRGNGRLREWETKKVEGGGASAEQVCTGSEYRKQTYLVIQIQKGLPSIGLDIAQSFAEFETVAAKATESDYTDFETSITKVLEDFKSDVTAKKTVQEQRNTIQKVQSLIRDIVSIKEESERTLLLLELQDLINTRPGFKNPDGSVIPFSTAQAQALIDSLRRAAKDPYKINLSMLESTVEAKTLDSLLKTSVPAAGAAGE